MKRRYKTFLLINTVSIVFMSGYLTCHYFSTGTIPTRVQLQTRLVEAGYNIGPKGIDGKIGTDTNAALRQHDRDVEIENYLKRHQPFRWLWWRITGK